MRKRENVQKEKTFREAAIQVGKKALMYVFFVVVTWLCVKQGIMMNMPTVSAYKDSTGEDILTLDDYLAGDSNCFTEQLLRYRSEIAACEDTLQQFQEVMSDRNWEYLGTSGFYRYSGPDYTMPDDTRYLEDYKQIYLDRTGSYVSNIRLYNGNDYDTVQYNGYKDVCREIELKRDALQDEYNELSMIYGGFSIVGYNAGDVFTVDVKKNDVFIGSDWTDLDAQLYGTGNKVDAVDDDANKPTKTEKYIAEPLGNGAWKLYKWMYQWDIDLTIDGLVYGRMASSYKGTVDFTHFGLENNNPYGIVGATAYYVLRRILLSAMPVIMLVMLIMQLFKNTNKGRAQLKEMATSLLMVIAFLFLAPYALNLIIYFRDGVLRVTNIGMTAIFNSIGLENGSVGGSIIGMMYAVYDNNHSFLNALLLCAAVGSGFVYFVTYIKMAVLLAGCFAILPLILFISIWNKKILTDWWNIFFPNLCAPFIDVILLQIPSIILLVYKAVVKGNGSIVLGILLMVIIWVTMTIRERIIRLLGFDGIGGQRGLGMMGGMMLLARQLGNSAFRRGGGREALPESNIEKETDKEIGAFERARGAIMNQAQLDNFEPPAGEDVSFNPNLGSQTDDFLSYMDDYQNPDNVGDILNGDNLPDDTGVYANEQGGIGVSEEFTEPLQDAEAEPAMEGPYYGESVSGLEPVSDIDSDNAFTDSYVQDTPVVVGNAENFRQPMGSVDFRMDMKDDIQPMVDIEFRNSLSDKVSVDRYNNLAKMDGYNNRIAQNEATMRNSGYTGQEHYLSERSSYLGQIDKLNHHINATRDRMNGIADKSSEEYGIEKKNLTSALARKSELSARVGQLDHAAKLERDNAVYRQRAKDCMQREAVYAKNAALGGMRSNTYSSAREYMYQRKVDDARHSLANFKNFDTKRYEGILSPSEREAFYREREINQKRQRIIEIAGKTAGAAVSAAGVAGAAAAGIYAAYGGAGASSMAVGATVLGARTAGNVAERAVNGAGRAMAQRRKPPVAGNDSRSPENKQTHRTSIPPGTNDIPSENHVLERLKSGAQSQMKMLDQEAKEQKVLKELQERANKGAK